MKPRQLKVTMRGDLKVCGELWNALECESMTCTISKGRLELNLTKANKGLMWEVFCIENNGKELETPEMMDILTGKDVPIGEEPLPVFNSQELEECDAFPSDSFALSMFNFDTNAMEFKTNLSGHQWLFKHNLDSPQFIVLETRRGWVHLVPQFDKGGRRDHCQVGTHWHFPSLGICSGLEIAKKVHDSFAKFFVRRDCGHFEEIICLQDNPMMFRPNLT